MQGWGHWVIILIGAAVWIFSHLLKAGNEQQQQQRRQQQQQGGGPRRPGGDIDRFLQEIQRRRQGAPKSPPAERVPPPPVVRETPRPVKPPPMPRRVERERAPVLPPPRQRPTERPRPLVPPVEVVVLEEVKPAVPVSGIEEAHVAPSERAAYRAPTVSAAKTPTEGAKKLVELLSTKEGLQAAILMNEVIGPPRCKRHHGI